MDTPSSSRSWSLVIASVMLGLGLIGGAYLFSRAYHDAHVPDRSIDVSGSAEQLVSSDTAKWSLSISRQSDALGLKDAASGLAADSKAVTAYLLANGLKKEEITLQPPSITPVCDGQGSISYDRSGTAYCGAGRLIGYSLQQPMVVESSNVDTVTSLAQSAFPALAGQGIVMTSAGIEYYVHDLNAIKMKLLAEATKNAQDRAAQILTGTGASIGELRSASVGVFQVTAVNSTEISDYGAYDTAAVQKKVTSIVRASFALK